MKVSETQDVWQVNQSVEQKPDIFLKLVDVLEICENHAVILAARQIAWDGAGEQQNWPLTKGTFTANIGYFSNMFITIVIYFFVTTTLR